MADIIGLCVSPEDQDLLELHGWHTSVQEHTTYARRKIFPNGSELLHCRIAARIIGRPYDRV